MQRKQQVGECWVYVIFFACVCEGTSGSTIVSDDPSSSVLCVVCTGRFLEGPGMAPLGYTQRSETCSSLGSTEFGAVPQIFFPPQQMRSNPPSATTSPRKSLQPKTEIKTQDEAPMKIQDGSSSLSS
jgi:hypothetical protein